MLLRVVTFDLKPIGHSVFCRKKVRCHATTTVNAVIALLQRKAFLGPNWTATDAYSPCISQGIDLDEAIPLGAHLVTIDVEELDTESETTVPENNISDGDER
jgi:hypothetical protein